MCKFPNLLWGPSVWGSDGESSHVFLEPDSDFRIMSSLFPTIVGAPSHFICFRLTCVNASTLAV